MEVMNIDSVEEIRPEWGTIKELSRSENVSISHITVNGTVPLHKHNRMEEIYFLLQGSGTMQLGEKKINVKKGDSILIPVNTPHDMTAIEKPIVMVVVTQPNYDPDDEIPVQSSG